MLPEIGPISWMDVARELVWPPNKPLPMNASEVYALIGKAPGSSIRFPDDFRGKAFLDIIPDQMKWGDITGSTRAMGVNRTFTGLAFGVQIEIVIEVTVSVPNFTVFEIYQNDVLHSSVEIQNAAPISSPRIPVTNATKLKFGARNVSSGPFLATVRVLNGSFYDEEIDRFLIDLS